LLNHEISIEIMLACFTWIHFDRL